MKNVEAEGPLLMIGEGWIEIRVRLQPRASSEGFAGVVDRTLVVRVTEPPVEGRANRALQSLFAKRLRIPKRAVEIVLGKTSRMKRVRLHGVTLEHLAASIEQCRQR